MKSISELFLRSRERTPWLTGLLALVLSAAGRAQADILLNVYDVNARIERLRQDGTPVWTSSGGTGTEWEGCTLTSQGRVACTRRGPQAGINLFDASGAQVQEFPTPTVAFVPGDLSMFSDGTLAVVSQAGPVQLYTQAGTFVSSMNAGALHPFGCHIDSHDNLFLCDIVGPSGIQGRLHKLNRAGQVLLSIPLPWDPADLVAAPDDTLWVADRINKKVRRLDAGFGQLGEFPVAVSGLFSSIALADDGTLFVSGESSTSILHYSDTGVLLGSFPIPGPSGSPLFMTIERCASSPQAYCTAKLNSLGCTPQIAAVGSPSASANSGFIVSGANVRNQKPGLLLYSVSGRNSMPFQGGFLCVMTPLRRTPATNSAGSALPANDCSGAYAIDMNAFAQGLLGGNPLPALRLPATTVECQWWGRDPGFPAPNNSTLTGGLEYLVCL